MSCQLSLGPVVQTVVDAESAHWQLFSLTVTFADLGKLNWPLERSHFPTHDQSPDSIHSCQRCYGLNMRQTVCNFLQCNMSKRGDHGTAYESDRWGGGGAVALLKRFF